MEKEYRVISSDSEKIIAVFAVTRNSFCKTLQKNPNAYKDFYISTHESKHFKSIANLPLNQYESTAQNFYNMIFHEYGKYLIRINGLTFQIKIWIKLEFPSEYEFNQCCINYTRKDYRFCYFHFIRKFYFKEI